MKEKLAVSVIEKAWNIYFKKIGEVPQVTKRLSIDDIRQIFSVAVEPAIEEVRRLDRDYKND